MGLTSPAWVACAPTLARWIRARSSAPLAAWIAWDGPQTSQLSVVRSVGASREVLTLGGNRSGKTEAMRAIVVALVLGSDHPHARLFWQHHGMDPDQFPRGPGTGWLIALASNDSINYHRRWVERLLPADSFKWWNRNGPGEARVEIHVPGYDVPAEIVFKSEDQGEEAAQGASVRVVAHDEEGATPRVYDESGVRLWDQRGWHLMANTPVNGQTWVYHRFVREGPPPGATVNYIWTLDNPYVPPEAAMALERQNPALANARLRGEFVVLKGRIWPAFTRAIHTVRPFEVPSDWPRFRALDFGTQAPFVCLWSALAKRDHVAHGVRIPEGAMVVYREHYRRQWTIKEHVAHIRSVERDGEVIEATWADPESPQDRLSLNRDHGMDVTPANNAIKAGIECVAARIAAGLLFVFDDCTHTIREVEGWTWMGGEDGGKLDEPSRKDDHTCDCVRYTAMGLAAW